MLNKIHLGDCLEVMKDIPTGSVDMILADLPYGTTACKWDTIIPFEPLWAEYERVIKDNGAIVLTSKEPFTCVLRTSNLPIFKQPLVWRKENSDNPMQAKRRHLNVVEDISVFYKKQCTYNPQGLIKKEIKKAQGKADSLIDLRGSRSRIHVQTHTNYPINILKFSRGNGYEHPTQKPVPLFEYLIRTYTNEGETVLDNVIGSGTTAIACMNTNRNFIGIEMDKGYHELATNRIEEHQQQLNLM